MARATTAEVKKLTLGEWPPSITDAKVADLLDEADYVLDTYALKHYNTSLSTTSDEAKSLANRLVYRMIMHGQWVLAGGPLSQTPEPKQFTQAMKDRIEMLCRDTTYDGLTTGKMQEES